MSHRRSVQLTTLSDEDQRHEYESGKTGGDLTSLLADHTTEDKMPHRVFVSGSDHLKLDWAQVLMANVIAKGFGSEIGIRRNR
jgi:hypothetical protein